MRPLTQLKEYAIPGVLLSDSSGAFMVPCGGNHLRVIASTGMRWDHVSVSLEHRIPDWIELEHVKRLFFRDNEWAYQLHAPPTQHINIHPNCLHLWRPQKQKIPLPPAILV